MCAAIERGATSVEELAQTTGAGLRCKMCRPLLEEVLAGVQGVPTAGRTGRTPEGTALLRLLTTSREQVS